MQSFWRFSGRVEKIGQAGRLQNGLSPLKPAMAQVNALGYAAHGGDEEGALESAQLRSLQQATDTFIELMVILTLKRFAQRSENLKSSQK